MVAALADHDASCPRWATASGAGLCRRARAARAAAGQFRRRLQPYRRGGRARAGIAVTNTPGAVTDATADIALTLMLMTAAAPGEGERLVRAGRGRAGTPRSFWACT
jgi:phosphoglycerate dehydrogenase-like enzyme